MSQAKYTSDNVTQYSLPIQRLPFSQKGKLWGESNVNYFIRIAATDTLGNRSTNYRKAINYELFNGRFNPKDLEYVCNPLGIQGEEYPASLQHFDIISPAVMLLMGEESSRAETFIAVSEGPEVINRKNKSMLDRLKESYMMHLMAEVDPESLPKDEEGNPIPPPTPKELEQIKYHTFSDLLEQKANQILRVLKKKLNTQDKFNRGFKDALIAAEEIYWIGINNAEPDFRKCNPLNITCLLNFDSDFIDDASAIVEERLLTIPTILDEIGDKLTPLQVKELEDLSKNYSSLTNSGKDNFVVTQGGVEFTGAGTSFVGYKHDTRLGLIRVFRVEWISMKKVGILTYSDENQIPQEQEIDELFDLSTFKEIYPDAEVKWFWINEAWEGIKIADNIFVGVQPKQNQRRRLDNPYFARLGYTGLIYNATNSVSVSLIDRLKPYQYLYNILMYRLELAFASDQGKVFLMDLAQIPRSEGIDVDKWIYYLKSAKIGFINSFEEGKKGAMQGQRPTFNQFQAIDLSLSNTIQQYVNSLEFIRQQVANLSGITPQRLGSVKTSELVGNVERSIEQSSYITEYYFRSHAEVKRRVFEALLECAKIAYRTGKAVQYILDDLQVEVLSIEEYELDTEEFAVFISDSVKDQEVLNTLKSLYEVALKQDKIMLSDIVSAALNDSPRDVAKKLKYSEEAQKEQKMQEIKAAQEAQVQANEQQMQMYQEEQANKQADRDLKKYEIDTKAITELQKAEISALGFAKDTDVDQNGIPDVVEISKIALDERKHQSENFRKIQESKDKISLEKEKLNQAKKENETQERLAKEANKIKLKEIASKEKIARMKPKPKK